MASPKKNWTIAEIEALGVVTDIETAGQILGIGRAKAYQMAQQGTFPVRVLEIGCRYRVPTS